MGLAFLFVSYSKQLVSLSEAKDLNPCVLSQPVFPSLPAQTGKARNLSSLKLITVSRKPTHTKPINRPAATIPIRKHGDTKAATFAPDGNVPVSSQVLTPR